MLQIRCISDYNLKWYYYFCLERSRWHSLYNLDTLTRTRKTFRGRERNVRRSSGRIVERDFHTALITRPGTRRAKCSGRHGMPLHVKRGQVGLRQVVRAGYVRQRRVTRARPFLGEEESDASDSANAGYFEC